MKKTGIKVLDGDNNASSSRRPELAADAAWDAALDLGLRRTGPRTLGGLVAAAVLFRE